MNSKLYIVETQEISIDMDFKKALYWYVESVFFIGIIMYFFNIILSFMLLGFYEEYSRWIIGGEIVFLLFISIFFSEHLMDVFEEHYTVHETVFADVIKNIISILGDVLLSAMTVLSLQIVLSDMGKSLPDILLFGLFLLLVVVLEVIFHKSSEKMMKRPFNVKAIFIIIVFILFAVLTNGLSFM
jgi:hypothetical protein